jgi:2-hydroxycyclohexanecarboxyl-CoA dehydrogenase
MSGTSGVTGRVALVTGGARGIGAAVVAALAEAGAAVVVGDVDETGAIDTAARTAKEHGTHVLGIGMDIADRASVDAAIATTEAEVGPLSILVNNAGIDVIKPFIDSTPDEWERIIAVNLMGTFHCCQSALAVMQPRGGGAIVNFASDAGRVGSSREAVYSATKGGVIAFTKTLAREVARYGIRVNCVSPGPTDTALLDQVAEASPNLRDALARSIPMRRVGEPTDLAPAVVFLAGDGARYITGQTLSVSGGLTMA